MPTPLRTLFDKPIDRHIEGVIKADDESDLLTEVSEYVVTREVAKRLDELLAAYLAGGLANGVWIAGFFQCCGENIGMWFGALHHIR